MDTGCRLSRREACTWEVRGYRVGTAREGDEGGSGADTGCRSRAG